MIIKYDSTGDGTENATLSNIKAFPTVSSRLNKVGSCSIVVIDKLGALYATWSGYDYRKIKIEDDSSNVIFRGYVSGVKYQHNEMIISCRGIGAIFEWNTTRKNYILAEGIIKTVPYAGVDIDNQTIILRPNNDADINWSLRSGGLGDNTYIDDAVETGEAGDGLYIGCIKGDDDEFEDFNMTTTPVTSVESVTVHVRAKYVQNDVPFGLNISEDGVAWEGLNYEQCGSTSYAWVSHTWSALGWGGNIDNMQIRIRAPNFIIMVAGDEIYVDVMYIVVTYTHSSGDALELQTLTEGTWSWTDDYWAEGRDTGIMVVDQSENISSYAWQRENAVTTNNADGNSGAEVNMKVDNWDYYGMDDSNTYDMDMEIPLESVGAGEDIASATYTLDRIQIKFKSRLVLLNGGNCRINFYLYNFDDVGYTLIKSYSSKIGVALGESYLDVNFNWRSDLTEYVDDVGDDGKYDKVILKVNVSDADFSVAHLYMDIFYVEAEIFYATKSITPIMDKIDASGDEWVYCSGTTWADEYVFATDHFRIGENTGTILSDLSAEAGVNIVQISEHSKYMARWFRGDYIINIINQICQLEGWVWYEDYINDRIVIGDKTDFTDSTVDLTNANEEFEWVYNDNLDFYKKVEVYGCAAYGVYASYGNEASTSLKTKSIIDESIMSNGDADAMASELWAIYQSKQPSIMIPLNGTQANVQLGTTVDLDMDNPDIDNTYEVRRIDRIRRTPTTLKTTIWLGLGQTPIIEDFANKIDEIAYMSRKAHTDRLISTPFSAGGSITWGDIGGATAGVETVITAELVGGQSIDNAIDALIAAYDHDEQTIHPHIITGEGGFISDRQYGSCHTVVFSDVNAGVAASFYVRDGGNFKVSIVHSGNGANDGKEASGKIYISYAPENVNEDWNVLGQNFDLVLDNAEDLCIDEYSAAFTVANDSKVGVLWLKDDNAGGAAGNMWVYNIILKRQ